MAVVTALESLASRLESDVPAKDGVPSNSQYERCVQEAVADFGRRAGRYKIAMLSILAGMASYALPVDFVRLIRLESLEFPDNVMHTAAGLVPLSTSYSERWTIAGGQITFYPMPTYSVDRYLHYQAGWTLDANGAYQELDEEQAGICLLLAVSKALTLQANKTSQQAWQYQIGDERVSKERLAEAIRAQASQANQDYKAALSAYNGAHGSRADYPKDAYQ